MTTPILQAWRLAICALARQHPPMQMDDDFPRVFTPRTLAEHWECSDKHVRNLISSGQLPAFRLGEKLVRILRADVEQFERDQQMHQPVQPEQSETQARSLPLRQKSALSQLAQFPAGEFVSAANIRDCGDVTQRQLEAKGYVIVRRLDESPPITTTS
jgi:excisionase family DNA binding protein